MNAMTTLATSHAALARDLLVRYVSTIDDGKLADWPAHFCDPGVYRITTRDNFERGMPLSIMLCDNHMMLFDRVEAIEKANVFEPHMYRHILSDTVVVAEQAGRITTSTSFICVRTMVFDGSMTLFAAGRYLDEVAIDGGTARYAAKTVVLDASKVDTLIAIPL
jgi:anthranilate 1,2-dioxygenase small subunit